MVDRARSSAGVTGLHINAIGGDCPGKTELDIELVKRGSVFVEFPEQSFIEGEIQFLPHDWPITELWRVLTGDAPGRTADDQLTIFDSVGFAIEDFAALTFLNARLDGTDYYDELDLIAEPADPKNLFELIEARRPTVVA